MAIPPEPIHWWGSGPFIAMHLGWFLTRSGTPTRQRLARDWWRYPELRFIDRRHLLGPVVLAAATLALGAWLEMAYPRLGTSAWQMFVWGFVASSVVLDHATYTINSLSHQFGSQRFRTGDDSRNYWLLAILTLGEGWHNNHHHYPASARQGFYGREYDPTCYGLRMLSMPGVIGRPKPVPAHVLERDRIG